MPKKTLGKDTLAPLRKILGQPEDVIQIKTFETKKGAVNVFAPMQEADYVISHDPEQSTLTITFKRHEVCDAASRERYNTIVFNYGSNTVTLVRSPLSIKTRVLKNKDTETSRKTVNCALYFDPLEALRANGLWLSRPPYNPVDPQAVPDITSDMGQSYRFLSEARAALVKREEDLAKGVPVEPQELFDLKVDFLRKKAMHWRALASRRLYEPARAADTADSDAALYKSYTLWDAMIAPYLKRCLTEWDGTGYLVFISPFMPPYDVIKRCVDELTKKEVERLALCLGVPSKAAPELIHSRLMERLIIVLEGFPPPDSSMFSYTVGTVKKSLLTSNMVTLSQNPWAAGYEFKDYDFHKGNEAQEDRSLGKHLNKFIDDAKLDKKASVRIARIGDFTIIPDGNSTRLSRMAGILDNSGTYEAIAPQNMGIDKFLIF